MAVLYIDPYPRRNVYKYHYVLYMIRHGYAKTYLNISTSNHILTDDDICIEFDVDKAQYIRQPPISRNILTMSYVILNT